MGDRRYRAFVSYSHADEASGIWLQRSLERFRAPSSLAAALRAQGKSPRLAPVFRDRDELPVSGSLNDAIKAALADSDFQIVLCSPASARSRWVNEEIKLFHKLHGPGRVFALIIGGEPGAAATAGREEEECFPPALRFQLDAAGELTDAPAEILAADAREVGDGRRYALLKVAAGMLGVGLDDLVRRDAARRTRLAVTVSGGSIAAGLIAMALAATAIVKSREAATMRGKAENLIEFMLTDLRDRLEKVGRLDVLQSVGDKAMSYYADQDLKSLDDDALARRAKAMILLGSIDFRRNDLDAAQQAYEAAEQATGELLRRSPNSPERIFDHAQAVFYVGEAARTRGEFAATERQYREYLRLAETLIAIDAANPTWRLELAYATSNLGIVSFDAGDYEAAIPYFQRSIEIRRALLEAAPDDRDVAFAYAYAISWRVFAELARGDFRSTIDLIDEQLAVYGDEAGVASENFRVLDAVVSAQRRLALAHLALGELDAARAALSAAGEIADRLVARDSANANWNVNASHVARMKSYLFQLAGDDAASVAAADRALALSTAIAERERGYETYRTAQALALARRIEAGGDPGDVAQAAAALAAMWPGLLTARAADGVGALGSIALALARHEKEAGRADRAAEFAAAALSRLEPRRRELYAADRIFLARLDLEAGRFQEAASVVGELEKLGLAHPEFLAARADIQRAAAN